MQTTSRSAGATLATQSPTAQSGGSSNDDEGTRRTVLIVLVVIVAVLFMAICLTVFTRKVRSLPEASVTSWA